MRKKEKEMGTEKKLELKSKFGKNKQTVKRQTRAIYESYNKDKRRRRKRMRRNKGKEVGDENKEWYK